MFRHISRLSIYCGVPGSGKSSLAAATALQYMSHNLPVWSNVPIVGAFALDVKDLGRVDISGPGLVIIDEAGLDFDNRQFKSFTADQVYFFKYHRHHSLRVDVFSQSWNDMDLKIRAVAARLYTCHRVPLPGLGRFVWTREVVKSIKIDENTHQLSDFHAYSFGVGGLRPHYVASAWSLFDTHETRALPSFNFEIYS